MLDMILVLWLCKYGNTPSQPHDP